MQGPYSIVRGLECYCFVIGVERDIYGRHKINVNDKKDLSGFMIDRYTGDSAAAAGRMDGMLCDRIDEREIPAAAGGRGVVGDE